MVRVVCLLALGLAGCAAPSSPTAVARLGEPFRLGPGEEIGVSGAGLGVRFDGVRRDSRCPADALCVWGGEAVVALVLSEGRLTSAVALSTAAPDATVGAWRLQLQRVEPYPYSERPIAPEDYRVWLVVRR